MCEINDAPGVWVYVCIACLYRNVFVYRSW